MPSIAIPATVRCCRSNPGRDRSIELVSARSGDVSGLGLTATTFPSEIPIHPKVPSPFAGADRCREPPRAPDVLREAHLKDSPLNPERARAVKGQSEPVRLHAWASSSSNASVPGATWWRPRTTPKSASAETSADASCASVVAARTASKAPSSRCCSKRRRPRSRWPASTTSSGDRSSAYLRARRAASALPCRRARIWANSWRTSGVVVASRLRVATAATRRRAASRRSCSAPTASARIVVSTTISALRRRGSRPVQP